MSRSRKEEEANGSEEALADGTASIPQAMSPAKPRNAPRPHHCRNFIRRQTAGAMPDIVKKFVDMAKQGSVPHFTSLAKIGGLDQRSGATEGPKPRRRSLGRQLLDEVEEYEANQAVAQAKASASASQIDHRMGIPYSQERP